MNEPKQYVITAISPSQTRVQFTLWAHTAWEAVQLASENPNCADIVSFQLVEQKENYRPRPTSWLDGMITR